MANPLAISTRNLTKQFEGHLAVNHVNLQIVSGEIYGLIGPNGAGKTTLIRMLSTAEEPTTGEIQVNGHTLVRGQANPELKRQLGLLPDDFPLYEDLSVWDYLDYFARLYYLSDPILTQRLKAVLELVSLQNKRNSLIGSLSRGMKQRLSLARSIIHTPSILLLDEPVSGLDPIARAQFKDIIRGLQRQGMTILISSHILSDLAEFCTSIGIMELGRLVESAPLQELYNRLSQEQIIITSLNGPDTIQAHLKNYPRVDNCEILPDRRVRINFSGSLEEVAALLRSLVEAGIPITDFTRTHESLEAIFLKMGHQQTS
ncbi:MAG: ABC transporter ATP-binding protein [Leptolyngbyaceae cyanobacterium bins.59]|nr:ABC transporter ATP-binding protein [Leptolyngbyaceae cyanobacterium bins.59]